METNAAPGRRLRFFKHAAWICILAASGYAGCAMMAEHLVEKADQAAARDAASGLLVGAAPQELGPEDAPCAALFIHGFVGCGQNFGDAPRLLAEQGWRVRVMLLPGHGTSPRDLEQVSADAFLDAVRVELAALRARYGTVVLAGHSMGGALAALAASESHVDGLVLAAPYFGVTKRWYYVLPPETWLDISAPFIRWLYKGKLFLQVNRREAKNSIVSYVWVPTRAACVLTELGRRAGSRETLAKIDCPVLLLLAAGDAAASPEAARSAVDAMPSSHKECQVFSRSNHHLFFDYERDAVNQALLDFITALYPANME